MWDPAHLPKMAAFVIAIPAVLGCGDAARTAVRVTLEYDAAWDLEEIELAASGQRHRAAIAGEIYAPVPDDWDDTSVTFEVWGLRDGEPIAHGAGDVMVVRGQEVGIVVPLERIPCGAWCTEGEQTCRGDAVVLCERRDDGCLVWSEPVACEEAAPFCSLGVCRDDCVDECAAGEQRCAGPGDLQTCSDSDADDCLEWSAPSACEAEEVCSNGACRARCADECVAGETTCVGDAVTACADLDLDGCLEWGPLTSCDDATSCSGGACVDTCSDECTDPVCTGLSFSACGQFDSDPCLDRSPGVSCVPTDPCLVGACSAAAGCSTTQRECDMPPGDVCVDDETLRIFDGGGTCEAGACVYVATEIACPFGCSGGACQGCTPTSCAAAGAECGSLDDGCGMSLSCGACTDAYTCGSGNRCVGWGTLEQLGPAPEGRIFHTAVWTGAEMIVWGGRRYGLYFDDGARYSPSTKEWVTLPAGPLSARTDAAAVWTGSAMIVWGGYQGTTVVADGARFVAATGTWSSIADAPAVRSRHSAVWTGSEMITWGGQLDYSTEVSSGYRYSPATDAWASLTQSGDVPAKRVWHSAVWTGSEMIVWGGSYLDFNNDALTFLGDGARYDPQTGVWTAIESHGAPTPRDSHTAVWTGSEMVVFGGRGADSIGWKTLTDGARYDPDTDTWSPLTAPPPDSGRHAHAAVWTGEAMLLWGGGGCAGCWSSGLRWVPD